MRTAYYFSLGLLLTAGFGGSVSSGAAGSTNDGGSDSSSGTDEAGAVDAGGDARGYQADCDKSTTGLSHGANPASFRYLHGSWVITPGDDAYCGARNQGELSTFGSHGYELNIDYDIDDSGEDAGASDVDPLAPGAIRLFSDPDTQIETRTDRAHWKVYDWGVTVILCLDKVYNDGQLLIGFDVANRSGQRSIAICAGTNDSGD